VPHVTFIEPGGREVRIDVPLGWSLMQAATSNGVDGIEAACGGSCACATCHCYVEGPAAEHLHPPGDDEKVMLQSVVARMNPNSRLSCQIAMAPEFEGLIVRIAEVQS
jgi:2Fe-2S ferredoxin